MTKSSSSSDEDTSINKKNRHQFYETAIASASDADREIRMAESRGRERVLREVELRRSIKRVVWRVVAVLVICVGVLIWLLARRS